MKPQGYGSAILSFRFEAAHRQPEVGGKCRNLHGHSWSVQVTLYNSHHIGGVNPETGLSVEFSAAKNAIRTWIDHHFDHATLLGAQDNLAYYLIEDDCKVFLFGGNTVLSRRLSEFEVADSRHYDALPWPSVEAVAFCLGERLQEELTNSLGSYVMIESVMVSETETNTFVWASPNVREDNDHVISVNLSPGEQVSDRGLGMDLQ